MSKKIRTHSNRFSHESASQNAQKSEKLVRVYGVEACRAIIRERPNDVRRMILEDRRLKEFDGFLQEMAKTRRGYQILSTEEISRLTRTVHHEGVSLLAVEHKALSLEELLRKDTKHSIVLALDGVENPHNFGAIVRTAAYFGADAVVHSDKLSLSASSLRIAQGGGEHVPRLPVQDLSRTVASLRESGYKIVAADPKAKHSLFSFRLPQKVAFIFGAEGEGVSTSLRESADFQVMIPGTGDIQSLNVSAAVAICLAEAMRQKQVPQPASPARPSRSEAPSGRRKFLKPKRRK